MPELLKNQTNTKDQAPEEELPDELLLTAQVDLASVATKELPRVKDLEGLRYWMRGRNEAVKEIGTEAERQVLDDIFKDPDAHTRDELLDATFANFSGEAYGDSHWTKKYGEWGGRPEIITVYGDFMNSHPEWVQLSLDAGFMTHLPEFMDMLDKGEITATDYKGARQQLKEKLGTKTLWRGTMLTDEEFARVKDGGVGSPLSRVLQDSEQPEERFEAVALSAGPSFAIEAHFHGEHRASPFLSVSEYPDVAIAVGRHFGNKSPGKKFHLFKLNVPAIDLVSYTDHAFKTPSRLGSMQERNPDYAISVGVNGEESQHKWDESVESFVFWKLDATEIVEVSEPDVTESSWNNKVTGNFQARKV